jgi:hypothetical protein
MTTFSSPDVMRFLSKPVPSSGKVHRNFQGEVVSDLKERQEGVRIKHSVGGNSIPRPRARRCSGPHVGARRH